VCDGHCGAGRRSRPKRASTRRKSPSATAAEGDGSLPLDMSLNLVLDSGEEIGPNEKVDFTLPDRGS
jgi:hypothetical protein